MFTMHEVHIHLEEEVHMGKGFSREMTVEAAEGSAEAQGQERRYKRQHGESQAVRIEGPKDLGLGTAEAWML